MGTQFVKLARVVKMRGLEGEVTAHVQRGFSFPFFEGMQLHVVPPNLYGPRRLTLERARELDDSGTVALGFAEIGCADEAQALEDKWLLAAWADLDEEAIASVEDVLGLPVVDAAFGALGEIVEVIETAAHEVWVVEGRYGQVLIPAVEEFVCVEGGVVETRVPAGLVNGGVEC